MFVGIFKSNFQILIPVLFIIGIVIWLYSFINPVLPPLPKQTELFYILLYKYIILLPPIVISLIGFTLLFVQSLVLNNLIINFSLTEKNTYLPALVYFVLMSIFPSFCTVNQVLIVNLVVILCLNILFNFYLKEEEYAQIFNIAFVFSLLTLLYYPSVFYIVFLWIIFIIYRLFKWREWLISVIGFLLPFLFVSFYFFWKDNFHEMNMFLNVFKPDIIDINYKSIKIIIILFMQLLIFYTGIKYRLLTKDKIVMQRKLAGIFIALYILNFLPFFFIPNTSLIQICTTFLAASVFVSNVFIKLKKGWISELIFFTLIAVIIISRIYNF